MIVASGPRAMPISNLLVAAPHQPASDRPHMFLATLFWKVHRGGNETKQLSYAPRSAAHVVLCARLAKWPDILRASPMLCPNVASRGCHAVCATRWQHRKNNPGPTFRLTARAFPAPKLSSGGNILAPRRCHTKQSKNDHACKSGNEGISSHHRCAAPDVLPLFHSPRRLALPICLWLLWLLPPAFCVVSWF